MAAEDGESGAEAHLMLEVGLPGAQMAAAEGAEQAEFCSHGLQVPVKRGHRRINRLGFTKKRNTVKASPKTGSASGCNTMGMQKNGRMRSCVLNSAELQKKPNQIKST